MIIAMRYSHGHHPHLRPKIDAIIFFFSLKMNHSLSLLHLQREVRFLVDIFEYYCNKWFGFDVEHHLTETLT